MRFALLAAVVVIAAAVALVSLPEPASADHGDSSNIYLCATLLPGPYHAVGSYPAKRHEQAGCKDGYPLVARNVVEGKAIPVCSDDYPKSTEAAVKLWNNALGIQAFEWKKELANCPAVSTGPRPLVASVLVTAQASSGGDLPGLNASWKPHCWSELSACLVYENIWAQVDSRGKPDPSPWYAMTGRSEVRVNAAPGRYPPATRDGSTGAQGLNKVIAHELGHALALGDRLTCGNGVAPSLMQQQQAACRSELVTNQDLQDFAEIYTPGRATSFVARRAAGNQAKVAFTWTPTHVHVESGFDIERAEDAGFMRAGGVFPNEATLTIGAQPLGSTVYRVVSTTEAFGNAAPTAGSITTYTLSPAQWRLTLTKPAHGTLRASPAGPYAHGDRVTITATTNRGARITTWGGDCSHAGSGSLTCRLVMQDHSTVRVTIVPPPPPTVTPPTKTPTTTPPTVTPPTATPSPTATPDPPGCSHQPWLCPTPTPTSTPSPTPVDPCEVHFGFPVGCSTVPNGGDEGGDGENPETVSTGTAGAAAIGFVLMGALAGVLARPGGRASRWIRDRDGW